MCFGSSKKAPTTNTVTTTPASKDVYASRYWMMERYRNDSPFIKLNEEATGDDKKKLKSKGTKSLQIPLTPTSGESGLGIPTKRM